VYGETKPEIKGGNKMRKSILLVLFILGIVLYSACKPCHPCPPCPKCPDLIVSATVTWDNTNKLVNVTVTNIGNAAAGNFMVYINADENPVSLNHRPQDTRNVNGLAAGASIPLPVSDFTSLAHPDNNNLHNVYAITVIADPKNMVAECDSLGEINNQVTIVLSGH
jgi:hypothetical protein